MSGANQIGMSGRQSTAFPPYQIDLTSGGAYTLPSGQYMVTPGPYTFIQRFDPVLYAWRVENSGYNNLSYYVSSDGSNYRIANLCGTPVGAIITNAGTGYTNGIYYPAGYPIANNPNAVLQAGTASAPSVTFASGSGITLAAKANLVVGGAVLTTGATVTGGSGYTHPPTLVISPPPAGGVQATATITVSGGALSTVTVTNQGAGYTSTPTVTVVPHPIDDPKNNALYGGVATGGAVTLGGLTGSGTVTAIYVVDNGFGTNNVTATPAISFSPASTTAATAIMCVTAITVPNQAATNLGNGNIGLIGSRVQAGSSVLTNPYITTGLFQPRMGYTRFGTTATGEVTILDGGLHQLTGAVGTLNVAYASQSNGTISGNTTPAALTVGGQADTTLIIPM